MTAADKSRALRRDRDRFVAFAFAAADLLLEVESDGRIAFVAGTTRGILDRSPDSLTGTTLADLVAPLDQGLVARTLEGLKQGRRLSPILITLEGGQARALLGAFRLPGEGEARHVTLSAVTMPVAEAHQRRRDERTGVLDKDSFQDLASRQLELARETGQDVALTLIELGNLAKLQTELSEEVVDGLLSEIGSLLRASSLSGDSVGRLNSEKYGVMHAAALSGDDLRERVSALSAQRLREAGAVSTLDVAANAVDLSESSTLGDREAVQALVYTINAFTTAGGEDFSIGSLREGLKQRMDVTVARIQSLRRQIDGRSFKLVYQPIVHMETGALHHYEALSRFPDGSSPFETVVFAEEIGVIQDFDLAVCQLAWETLIGLPAGAEGAHIAINISARSIESDRFLDDLDHILARDPRRRRQVLFELTESAKLKDLNRAARVIGRWRSTGHKVCLDDFGAGAASYEYLRAFDLDYIKLDGQYVKSMLTNQRDAQILASMARLCTDLQVATIAEMVESPQQVRQLRQLGVAYGQGWHFGKPGPLKTRATAG